MEERIGDLETFLCMIVIGVLSYAILMLSCFPLIPGYTALAGVRFVRRG